MTMPDIDLPITGALLPVLPEPTDGGTTIRNARGEVIGHTRGRTAGIIPAMAEIAGATRPRARVRKSDTAADVDAELAALRTCAVALAGLDDNARARVLVYLTRRYATADTRREVERATVDDAPAADSE